MAYSVETKKMVAELIASGMDQTEIARRLHITPQTISRWFHNDPIVIDAVHAHHRSVYDRCMVELERMAFAETRVTGANKIAALDRILRHADPAGWDPVVRARERDIKRREEEERKAIETKSEYPKANAEQLDMFVERWVSSINADGREKSADSDNADD